MLSDTEGPGSLVIATKNANVWRQSFSALNQNNTSYFTEEHKDITLRVYG